ncbi:MAG: hypothetical protein B6I23_02240 [Rickettsiaceae bacterium 4572_127]|nr:MAG: hypothetical protein B6I23_02240 [Rickettsiaceae bacterium 4572_127]
MLDIPDFSNFIFYHFFDLIVIGGVYFAPTFFHKTLKTQGGLRRVYIMINLVLGWTIFFWFFSLYKAFFK